jgi:hypothetical protein
MFPKLFCPPCVPTAIEYRGNFVFVLDALGSNLLRIEPIMPAGKERWLDVRNRDYDCLVVGNAGWVRWKRSKVGSSWQPAT